MNLLLNTPERIAISASQVSVSIGNSRILHSIDVSLRSACWTSIVGPNGAGKSTLLKALAGLLLVAIAARVRAPEALILFGVALSSFAGALTALIFNLSPSPIASAEVMNWLLGSVQNRSWIDVAWVAPALAVAAVFAAGASPGLRMLTLGEEAARASGLSMGRMRVLALIASAVAAGAAVAVAGVIGFVGLAAPHLVRAAVSVPHGRLMALSSLMGGALLCAADLLARGLIAPQELPVGVLTAVLGGGYLLWLMHRRSSPGGVL